MFEIQALLALILITLWLPYLSRFMGRLWAHRPKRIKMRTLRRISIIKDYFNG